MNKTIAKNVIYNVIYQAVTLLMPIITVPYVSRVLGKEGIGIYGYTNSIVQYFIILGSLGLSLYANREIAYKRDNKKDMSNTFWSLFILNFITVGIALIVYTLIFCINNENAVIYRIQILNIVAVMIDISWLYMGIEDFKKTVTRNLIVKIIGVSCVFLFVKSYDDLNLYITIYSLMTLLGNVVMWGYLPKIVYRINFSELKIFKHLLPTLKLFVPQIAIQVYAILDKTMLGKLADTGEVGLYDQSQRIVQLVLGLVTSLGLVMLPRMSNTFAKGDNKKISEYLNNSLKGVAYISIPMAFGLASISKEFVPWFFGPGFDEVSYLMVSITPILFLIGMSNVLGMQYLMPTDQTKAFTASVTAGAITNVILNILLIPKYKALGACISTTFSEFNVTLIQYICVRKVIYKKEIFKSIIKYVFASILMFICVRGIGIFMGAKVITTVIQCIVGAGIYVIMLGIFRDETNKAVLKTVLTKVKKVNFNAIKSNS